MRIDCVRGTPELLALEPEWRSLLERSASNGLFLSWEWISTWWEVFGARFTPHVLVARDDDGSVCGIAPLMLGPGPGKARWLRHLMFIGQQGDVTSEYLDFIVAAGREAEVAPALVRRLLDEGWDALLLQNVRADSVCYGAFEEELAARGLRFDTWRKRPSPFTSLPRSWKELYDGRSRNFRSRYQHSSNVLARSGPVETVVAGRDIPLDEALDRLVELSRGRWGDAGQSFRTPAYVSFHRKLIARMHERDALLFLFLRANGRLVAARYDFVYAGKAWCYQSGWLREFEKVSLGELALGKVLELAISRGCREYDFLGGEAHYKRRWSTGHRTLLDVWAPRSGWARAWRWAKRTQSLIHRGGTTWPAWWAEADWGVLSSLIAEIPL
jgi:CelD/BcsL family acetyltransferase involved in cellulose biosynthesis